MASALSANEYSARFVKVNFKKFVKASLRSHAEHLAAVARAYSDLARRHRSAADAVAREKPALTAENDFTPWLLEVSELAASAERLVAKRWALAAKRLGNASPKHLAKARAGVTHKRCTPAEPSGCGVSTAV
ncbi:hypothetical protein Amsp01_010920 [Amycolatopsis sp. NBRC 101858]|uniref:hypothetical protein n=1 Tax=Amycolatopsis sp. NBRC 101858 TaxID=3032200 RepID=UPI0024A2240A|nr:hypothetical protein [Amycolatopsis sp. NBRC 101858]GLY35068.1 hypothetical protein Amsp01_010920 [Amycolatopsis sp. NBRC 101858]